MKLPNWFKIGWWALLVGATGYFLLFVRLPAIRAGKVTGIDDLLFIIGFALLLLPLFNEVDLLGVKFKSQIEGVKSELKEQILNLRSEVQTSIGVHTQVNLHGIPSPPADSYLPQIEKRFQNIVQEAIRELGIQGTVNIQDELNTPQEVSYLFLVRYSIEKQLRRIWSERFQHQQLENNVLHVPIFKITNALKESGLLEPQLANVIREIYVICSPAIHGEDVSANKVAFVRDIAPGLITALMAIK